jgi:hypothetical protein
MIKLSDLDATNVAISLILATALQTFAIISTTRSRSSLDYGTVFSIVLYVFEFSAIAPYVPTPGRAICASATFSAASAISPPTTTSTHRPSGAASSQLSARPASRG